MAFEDTLTYLTGDSNTPLALRVGQWMEGSPRFCAFVESYRDKIRKKVRIATTDEQMADLVAELAVAALLFRDQRLTVEYEKLGVGKQRAPDLTVIFKTHTPFHIEVTRLRISPLPTEGERDSFAHKLAGTICDKLGQLLPSTANLVALVAEQHPDTATTVEAAMRILRQRAEQQDESFFQQRGLDGVRHFHRQQLRLSGILHCTLPVPTCRVAGLWLNPQTKHPLPAALQNLLRGLV